MPSETYAWLNEFEGLREEAVACLKLSPFSFVKRDAWNAWEGPRLPLHTVAGMEIAKRWLAKRLGSGGGGIELIDVALVDNHDGEWLLLSFWRHPSVGAVEERRQVLAIALTDPAEALLAAMREVTDA